jgi:hypothetical protein
MSEFTKQIIRHLHSANTMQEIAEKAGLMATIRRVQDWQCKRLLVTYQDMYEQPRFKPAVEFFVKELYGPNDFSQRDKDIARLVPKMAKLLPDKALQSLASALHLNSLSFEMDFEIAKQLGDSPINRKTYAQAYVASDNVTARQQQIEFISTLGNDLGDVVRMKGISSLLFISRKPAKMAGVLALHEFLETGYKAFKHLGRVEDFVRPIIAKEQLIMTRLMDPKAANPLPEV